MLDSRLPHAAFSCFTRRPTAGEFRQLSRSLWELSPSTFSYTGELTDALCEEDYPRAVSSISHSHGLFTVHVGSYDCRAGSPAHDGRAAHPVAPPRALRKRRRSECGQLRRSKGRAVFASA